MVTYEMSPENRQRDRPTLQHTLSNNKYDPSIIKEIKEKKIDQAQREKSNGQISHTSENKLDLSLELSRIPKSKWRSLQIIQ